MSSERRWYRRGDYLIELGCGLSKPKLVIGFGHAGAGASWMSVVDAALDDEWGSAVVILPGRERRLREPTRTDVAEYAVEISAEIKELVQQRQLVVLFGQSFGGLLAFETCRLLEQACPEQPLLLITLGTPAPAVLPSSCREPSDDDLLTHLAQVTGLAPDAVREMAPAWLDAMRADMTLFSRYPWGACESIGSPLVATRGSDDSFTTQEKFELWRVCTRAGALIDVVPGAHLPTLSCVRRWPEYLNILEPRKGFK